MPKFYNINDPADLRELPQSLLAEWATANNPKRTEWLPAPAKPSENSVWSAGEWLIPTTPAISAEDHLAGESYSPLRLLTCLDLEGKLRATGTSSAKLSAVRSWLDTLTLAAAANPEDARSDWPAAPHPFDQVLTEALTALTAP